MDESSAQINEAVVGADGVLTLYLRTADGGTTPVRLDIRTQGLILQTLLGSTLDPLGPLARRFEPAAVARFRIDDDVGVSFLLSPQIGLHFVLDRSLATVLQHKLETFDDAASWDMPKLN
jgi:hypothetical protein